jgi:hypothetical protein
MGKPWLQEDASRHLQKRYVSLVDISVIWEMREEWNREVVPHLTTQSGDHAPQPYSGSSFECATFLMIHIRYFRALRILIRFWRLRLSSFAK